jgi:hypothetical protein
MSAIVRDTEKLVVHWTEYCKESENKSLSSKFYQALSIHLSFTIVLLDLGMVCISVEPLTQRTERALFGTRPLY